MHGSFPHKLKSGRTVQLPAPPFTVTYCVIEDDSQVTVFFGMKTPGHHSETQIMDSCRKIAPDLKWKRYAVADVGTNDGSPNEFEYYKLIKRGDKLVIDATTVGDMAVAFQAVGGEGAIGALAVPDLVQAIKDLGFPIGAG